MTKKELYELRAAYESGAPETRLENIARAKVLYRLAVSRLVEVLAQLRAQFRETKEAVTSQPVPVDQRPMAIERDVRNSRKSFWAGLSVMIAEVALAIYLAVRFNIDPLFVLLLTVVLPVGLTAAFFMMWLNAKQPEETERRIRRRLLTPAVIFIVSGLAVLISARGLEGVLAEHMAIIVAVALALVSLGCAALVTALFALSYAWSWSRDFEIKYRQVEGQLEEIVSELQRVEQIERSLRVKAAAVFLPGPARTRAITSRLLGGGTIPAVVLAFTTLLTFSGCGTSDRSTSQPQDELAASQTARPAPAVLPPGQVAPETEIIVYLDWSGSADEESFSTATRMLVNRLAEIIECNNVIRFEAYQFGRDGWSCEEIVSIDFPPLVYPEASRRRTSEAEEIYGKIREVNDERARQEHEARVRAALQSYRGQIRERLSGISESNLLPSGDTEEAACTDIKGVVARIMSSASGQRRQINILITDAAETCSPPLRLTGSLTVTPAIVVILAPEKYGENNSAAYRQFEERRREVEGALPWAVVRPPFATDLMNAIEQSFEEATATRR